MKKILVIIMSVLLLIGGVFYLQRIGLSALSRTVDEMNWPHTTGQVLHCSKQENSIYAKKKTFVFKLEVSYGVGDSTYVLSRSHKSDRDSWERYAKVVEIYPKGSQLEVYYDPNNPASSNYYLERNYIFIFLLEFAPLFILWLLGAWGLYVGLVKY